MFEAMQGLAGFSLSQLYSRQIDLDRPHPVSSTGQPAQAQAGLQLPPAGVELISLEEDLGEDQVAPSRSTRSAAVSWRSAAFSAAVASRKAALRRPCWQASRARVAG